jgi:serine/threonine-protein kinase
VRLVGVSSQGRLDIRGEVVRLMEGEPTVRGFGIKFDDLDLEQTNVLEALCRARGVETAAGDPVAEAKLRQFETRKNGDMYALIGIPRDSSTRRITDVCERLSEEMLPKQFPRLTPSQKIRLDALRLKLTEAEEVLIDHERRALYDAINGNVLGVLRCITEGLQLEKLEGLRAEFIKTKPNPEAQTKPALDEAMRAETKGDLSGALKWVAEALCHDPLNLALHRRAVELRTKSRAAQSTPPWSPSV